jgi:16S rRNA (uracil1498-N3)-methyltransferase
MRFYVSPESICYDKNIIEIKDKSEAHHICDVMRLGKGATVDVFDGMGNEFSGFITSINRGSIIIEIKNKRLVKHDRVLKITLYQAIPKKSKMDFIVEKAVELGVENIVPIVTERTVPDIKGKADKRVERWSKIAKASSKQSGRVTLPVVSDIINFNDALLEAKKNNMVIFAAVHKDARPLNALLKGQEPKTIAIFVGPEGDFSPEEISMAQKEGFNIYSLGKLILKSDTAGIYILSCLSYEYGD